MKIRKFTLAEIMVTVAIVAIVAAIALPGLSQNREVAVEQNKLANIKTLQTAILCYLMNNPQSTMANVDSFDKISPFLEARSRDIADYEISGQTVSIDNGVVTYVSVD